MPLPTWTKPQAGERDGNVNASEAHREQASEEGDVNELVVCSSERGGALALLAAILHYLVLKRYSGFAAGRHATRTHLGGALEG